MLHGWAPLVRRSRSGDDSGGSYQLDAPDTRKRMLHGPRVVSAPVVLQPGQYNSELVPGSWLVLYDVLQREFYSLPRQFGSMGKVRQPRDSQRRNHTGCDGAQPLQQARHTASPVSISERILAPARWRSWPAFRSCPISTLSSNLSHNPRSFHRHDCRRVPIRAGLDTLRHPARGRRYGSPRQTRIARRSLHLAVAEQAAAHPRGSRVRLRSQEPIALRQPKVPLAAARWVTPISPTLTGTSNAPLYRQVPVRGFQFHRSILCNPQMGKTINQFWSNDVEYLGPTD